MGRIMTSGTRLLISTLMTLVIGTTEVEENAFKLVREKVQRSSSFIKKSDFQRYSSFNKRDKVQFLVENRDTKVVRGLLEVKIRVIKELEKELYDDVKKAWKQLEEVHRQ